MTLGLVPELSPDTFTTRELKSGVSEGSVIRRFYVGD